MTLKEFGWAALKTIGEIIIWFVIIAGSMLLGIVLYNMNF